MVLALTLICLPLGLAGFYLVGLVCDRFGWLSGMGDTGSGAPPD